MAMEWCKACGALMVQKPLFTSFYYECPRCDSKPTSPPPSYLYGSVNTQIRRWTSTKGQAQTIPREHEREYLVPYATEYKDPFTGMTHCKPTADQYFAFSVWPSRVAPEYRNRLPDPATSPGPCWLMAEYPKLRLGSPPAELDHVTVKVVAFTKERVQYTRRSHSVICYYWKQAGYKPKGNK